MNEYILKTTPKFEKGLRSLEKPIKEAVLEQVKALKKDPYIGKKLHGHLKGKFSLRIGNYRVIYAIEERRVILLTVGHRKKIY